MAKLKEVQMHPINSPERFEDGVFRKERYQQAIDRALLIINQNIEVFIDRYPHVSEANVYQGEENKLWTASFLPGIAYLAYDLTSNKRYLNHANDYLNSFQSRLEKGHTVTHDLGFLYTLACVANYKLTGAERGKDLALRAAGKLAGRYNEKGRYLQAWGEIGLKYPEVKIIIDTMLNLPLLYWAAGMTGNQKYHDIAYAHAITASQTLVRDDASTYHTFLMNPETGEAVTGKTHQGKADESTWARGQSWAVYGYALSYAYTGEQYFLDVATRTANYFINNLPEDFVPYWDFTFNDNRKDIKDSSAGAILVCGLLELTKHLEGQEKEIYLKVAAKVMESLCLNYANMNTNSNGLLLHGMYHRNIGADECTIWGDYFYFEALVRLMKDWKLFW